MHYVYHIFDEKIGATENVERRVELEQGCEKHEYEILLQTEDLMEASKAEIHFQELHGYTVDSIPYHEIKNPQKTEKIMSDAIVIKKKAAHKWFSHRDLYPLDIKEDVLNMGIEFYIGDKLVKRFVDEEDADYLLSITQVSHKTSGSYWAPRAINKYFKQDGFKKEEPTGSKSNPNVCADLEVPKLDGESLDTVFELQAYLQTKFPETVSIGKQSIAETADASHRNLTAFLDEYAEFMEALGGVKDGYGNGAWKYWKKAHKNARVDHVSDLSDRDLLELKYEYVDMFHFFVNWGLMIGMTGTELIAMYIAKNKENLERQKRGY